MPNDNEKRDVTVSLSPEVLALLGLEADTKTEAIKERIEHLDQDPMLYRKTAAGTLLAGFDAEADSPQAYTSIIPKGKTDLIDLALVNAPQTPAGDIQFRLFEDPYTEEPTYTSSMQQEALLEATKDFPDEVPKEIAVSRDMTYNPAIDRLTLCVPHLHVTSVVHLGKIPDPQARTAFFGGHTIELDFPEKGTKATIHGLTGEGTLTIRSARPEEDVLLKATKTTLVVGPISRDGLSGKEGLRAYLTEGHPEDDVIMMKLTSMLERIAQMQKIAPKETSLHEEMEQLMKRPDFAYGKYYAHLYDWTLHPAFHGKEKEPAR